MSDLAPLAVKLWAAECLEGGQTQSAVAFAGRTTVGYET